MMNWTLINSFTVLNLMFQVDPKYLSTFIFMMRVTVTQSPLGSEEDANCARAINVIYWRMVILSIEMNGPRYLGFS